MKQKFLLVGLMFLFSLFSFAQQSGTCGDNLKWTLVNGMLSITGTGTMTNYDDFTNTPWYMNIHSIETLYVYHGVKSIGKNAFAWCNSLTSVTLPSSVIYIGEDAFNSCWKLKSITIPYGVESIGNGAFAFCSILNSVSIPNSVTSIGDDVFISCNSLISIFIPSSVKSIGDGPFSYCEKLRSISVDGNNSAYCDVDGVLFNKNKTTLVQYPIGKSATSYTIPNSVTSIGNSAFYRSKLQSINIPNSVTSIEGCAFYNCQHLKNFKLPNKVTYIGDAAFYGCNAFTDLDIPNSVTSIGNAAFSDCFTLTSVFIPNSVTSIGEGPFSSCSNLTSISVDKNNSAYCDIDGVLFNKSKKTLIQYPTGRRATSYTIPNSVTYIGKDAFSRYCYNLTSVTIPNSVTSIGYGAFYLCRDLKTLIIGSSLKELDIMAFHSCESIETITCYSTIPPTVKESALNGIPYSAIVYVPEKSFYSYYNHEIWGQFDVRKISGNGIEDVAEDSKQPKKIIQDGQVYIFNDNKIYSVSGTPVR